MLSKVRKWPCKPMITFTAQRNCCSLHVTVTSTPQNLTTDLSVSQGMCDILFVTRSALSFCDRASPCSHDSIFLLAHNTLTALPHTIIWYMVYRD